MTISPLNNDSHSQNNISYGTTLPGEGRKLSGMPALEEKKLPGMPSHEEKKLPDMPGDGRKADGKECQTCKNRKYRDGSDEMVSFKTAQHMSPESAAAGVRAHEQEHVSNAYSKAAQDGGKVLQASVSIHMSVCPECGRSYVSGGTTNTQIKYYNEENPYQQDLKAADHEKYAGANADYTV